MNCDCCWFSSNCLLGLFCSQICCSNWVLYEWREKWIDLSKSIGSFEETGLVGDATYFSKGLPLATHHEGLLGLRGGGRACDWTGSAHPAVLAPSLHPPLPQQCCLFSSQGRSPYSALGSSASRGEETIQQCFNYSLIMLHVTASARTLWGLSGYQGKCQMGH